MRGVHAGALVLATALLAGCGGGDAKKARRDAVNAYITQVNVATAVVLQERAQLNQALLGFSVTQARRVDVKRLRRVETKIRGVARKVRALEPPADAATLHADLLRLLDQQATLAGHLAWTSVFVPKLQRTLAPLTQARATLKQALVAAKTWKADSEAYGRYGASLSSVLDDLGRLAPPPELRPALDEQVRELRARARFSLALAGAFAKRDVKGVNAALRGLGRLTSQDEALQSYRAQVAVTEAYNERLDRISNLTVRIARERQRLIGALG
jgi:hypothetical protein